MLYELEPIEFTDARREQTALYGLTRRGVAFQLLGHITTLYVTVENHLGTLLVYPSRYHNKILFGLYMHGSHHYELNKEYKIDSAYESFGIFKFTRRIKRCSYVHYEFTMKFAIDDDR